jgi:DNA repair exonuclease SbcCD nuclease subunit
MKVALLGDTHFGARNDSPIFHKYFEKFYSEVFFPYLKEHNVLHVVQLGDLFDRRKYINFSSLKSSHDYFFNKLNNEYTTWALVGNHDTYYKNTNEVNSLDLLLGGFHNITAVTEPTEVEFEEVTFLLVPWISEENHQRCMDAIKNTSASVIIGHFEITGFEMHKGAVCDDGMDRSLFANSECVLSGHFHHRSKHNNIEYLGTPYEMTWSDFDDPKGFHIYDTEKRELTFVPNPFKMFHKVFYDDGEGASTDSSTLLKQDFSMYADTFVKVIVQSKNDPYCFDIFIDRLEKAGTCGIQVVDDHFHMDEVTDTDIISEAEDTLTILNKYVEQTAGGIDSKKLTELMRSLYNEALSVE